MDHVSWSFGLFSKPPLGRRPNTKPRDHDTPKAHNRWFILFYHAWGLTWIDIYWNSIWLRARSHTTSHYTWGVRDHTAWFWRCVGTAFGHLFLWTLTISWSRLLARVWSSPRWILLGSLRTLFWHSILALASRAFLRAPGDSLKKLALLWIRYFMLPVWLLQITSVWWTIVKCFVGPN